MVWGSLCMLTFHWFDMPERLKFTLVAMVHKCLHHKAPRYLVDYCIPISDVASRHLRSARPRCALTQSQLVWALGICCCQHNCLELTDDLRDPTLSTPLTISDVCLKLGCFQSTHSASEVSHFMRYINSWLTYLLTYLHTKLHCEPKNWATFLRPITLEILNRSLPNLAQITFSSCSTSCPNFFESTLENSGAIWK